MLESAAVRRKHPPVPKPRSKSAAPKAPRTGRTTPPPTGAASAAVRRISTRRTVALAEWRRVDLTPLEEARRDSAKSVGDLVHGVMEEMGLDRRRAEAEIVKVWNNLVDPQIAAHAQPAGLRNGTLFVTVDSSVWLDEIVRYRRRDILARLQTSFGRESVQRISFRVG
jgi:predicted nucleic acid-binding Zn ribbon protein